MKNKTIKKILDVLIIILMIFAFIECVHIVRHHQQMDEFHDFIHQQTLLCGQEMSIDDNFICD